MQSAMSLISDLREKKTRHPAFIQRPKEAVAKRNHAILISSVSYANITRLLDFGIEIQRSAFHGNDWRPIKSHAISYPDKTAIRDDKTQKNLVYRHRAIRLTSFLD